MPDAEETAHDRIFPEYGAEEEMPLGAYAVLLGIYAGVFGGAFAALKDRFPERFSPQDLLVTGVATHKISRIVTLGKVTSPLRAPVTTFKKPLGAGEVKEQTRGHGLTQGVGHLLTCPFCFGTWAAAGMAVGWGAAPRLTRMIASTFAAAAASDFLNQAYIVMKRKAKG